MKTAILKRNVEGKNFKLRKGTKVYITQKLNSGYSSLVRKEKDSTMEYPVPDEALKIVKDEVKVKIHTKRLPRRNDAMFYYGKHIATVSNGKRKLIVEASGEMTAAFTMDGEAYGNEDLAKQFKKRGTTDRGLATMGTNDLVFLNNWFRIVDAENDGEIGIVGTYDDAIQFAKDTLTNE
jgi:hypothetical protein